MGIMGNAGSISSTVGQACLPQAQPWTHLGPGVELLCDNLKTSTKPKSTERSKSSAKMRKAEIPEKAHESATMQHRLQIRTMEMIGKYRKRRQTDKSKSRNARKASNSAKSQKRFDFSRFNSNACLHT